jgi:hypothetical protein
MTSELDRFREEWLRELRSRGGDITPAGRSPEAPLSHDEHPHASSPAATSQSLGKSNITASTLARIVDDSDPVPRRIAAVFVEPTAPGARAALVCSILHWRRDRVRVTHD